MLIIGISGKKLSGKDTIADLCLKYYKKYTGNTGIKVGFADEIYREVAIAIWPAIQYDEQAIASKVLYIKSHKDNFRLILQGWGSDYKRELVSQDYWIKKWIIRANSLANTQHLLVCPDMRRQNDYETIDAAGGHKWRVTRDQCIDSDSHLSENDLDKQEYWDYEISNNGSLEELEEKVSTELLKTLTFKKIK